MFSANARTFLFGLSLVVLLAGFASSNPRKPQRLASGTWGGMHIRLNVEARAATVEYDCASGTIDGPLNLDSKGRFNWRGTFHRERPGPTRADDPGTDRAATYSGSVKGDRMTLTVRLTDTGDVLQTYALKRGGFGRVVKCK
ncbi:MAG TPA: hypothetical protein VIW64_05055 [Pyrinomonadaceae bacterium]|jgi:hypothetical protein